MLQPPKVDPTAAALPPPKPKLLPVGPLPSKPPISGLIPLGITASSDEVNNVFQQITDAHLKAFGVKPTPGLVFDVFRGVNQGKVANVDSLMDVPHTPQAAEARKIAAQITPMTQEQKATLALGHGPLDKIPQDIKDLFGYNGPRAKPLDGNRDVSQLWADEVNPNSKRAIARKSAGLSPTTGAPLTLPEMWIGEIGKGLVDFIPGVYKMTKAGLFDGQDAISRYIEQPLGIDKYQTKGSFWDPLNASNYSLSGNTKIPVTTKINRLSTMGIAQVKQVPKDFSDPKNWGYAAMDLWAAVTLGSEGAARLAAGAERGAEFAAATRAAQGTADLKAMPKDELASTIENWADQHTHGGGVFKGQVARSVAGTKAEAMFAAKMVRQGRPFERAVPDWLRTQLTKGQGIGAKARGEQALQFLEGARKPGPAPAFELGWGSYTERIPMFENAALRMLQRTYLEQAQQRLLTRQLAVDEDGDLVGFNSVNVPVLTRIYDAVFSTENLLHRARMQRNQIEFALAMAPANEMARLGTWSQRAFAARQWMKLNPDVEGSFRKMIVKHQIAAEKAITLVMSDVADPITAWRSFHNRMIDQTQEQRADFLDQNPSKTKILQEKHAFHRQQYKDLKEQLADLRSSSQVFEDRKTLEQGMRFDVPNTPKIREKGREMNATNGPEKPVKVRRASDGSLKVVTTEGHETLAAARHAGFNDIPIEIEGERLAQIGELEAQMKEQGRLAREVYPEMRKGEKVTDLTKGQRKDRIADFQYTIDNHTRQLDAIDLAEELLAKPTEHFRQIVDRAYEISASQERLKELVFGFDPEIGAQHLAEIVHILQGKEPLEPLLDENNRPIPGRRGVRVPGKVPDEQLAAEVKRTDAELKKEEGKMTTLEMARRRSKTPSVEKAYDEQIASLRLAEDAHRDALAAQSTQGSKVVPLERSIVGKPGETPAGTPSLETVGEMREGRGSAYTGRMEREVYRKQRTSGRFAVGRGRYGLSIVKNPTTSHVRMDGSAMQIGDNRWDVSNLLQEDQSNAFRAALAYTHWKDLWDIGIQDGEKISPYHMPVRDIQSVPAHLRKVVTALEKNVITPNDAKIINKADLEQVKQYLFPERNLIDTSDPHVRWVDERLTMSRFAGQTLEFWQGLDRVMDATFGVVNEPWRFLTIFATPAYILNAGGAAVTLAVEHGFASPGLLGRAIGSHQIYGPELTRLFDRLVGSTIGESMLSERGPITIVSRTFEAFWQKWTDQSFRRAAIIGELMKRGVIHDGMSQDEMLARVQTGLHPMMKKLGAENVDAETGHNVIESAQVARKQMLDFDKMSWPERASLRHIIFVYSFLRAGSIWSIRFMGEHPAQFALTAQAGRDRANDIKKMIGPTPSWFGASGFIPFAPGQIWNPMQFNMPSVLVQTAQPFQSLFSNAPYSNMADTLGGGPQIAKAIFTGKNAQGKPLPGGHGSLAGSFLDLLENSPVGYGFQRQQKAAKQAKVKIPPPPVEASADQPLSGLLGRENAFLKLNSYDIDGFWNNWGRVIFRTGVPINVNREALAARYWRDLRQSNPKQFIQFQMDLANELVKRQATVLNMKNVPADVTNGMNLMAERELFIQDWRNKTGRSQPGDAMQASLTIQFLKEQGLITPQKAASYRAALSKSPTATSSKGLWMKWVNENGALPWRNWSAKVSAVDYFNKPQFTGLTTDLKQAGLGDYTKAGSFDTPNTTKWAYGRQYETYQKTRTDLKTQEKTAQTSEERALIREQIRNLDNQASAPVFVDGISFPPYRAIAYGKLTPENQAKYKQTKAVGKWTSLDAFDRELLTGKQTDPSVFEGYGVLADWLDQASKKLAVGQHLPSNTRAYYEQVLISRATKSGNTAAAQAFKADIAFSKLPLSERMARMTPITQSRYSAQWDYLLSNVDAFRESYIKAGWVTSKGNPNWSGISDGWQRYGVPLAEQWISKQDPGFKTEVNTYIESHPSFLHSLVRP